MPPIADSNILKTYGDLRRKALAEGRDYMSVSSGMADHWVCVHCGAWSPGEWGETEQAVKHKEGCPIHD